MASGDGITENWDARDINAVTGESEKRKEETVCVVIMKRR